jgi:hypothetical protein
MKVLANDGISKAGEQALKMPELKFWTIELHRITLLISSTKITWMFFW